MSKAARLGQPLRLGNSPRSLPAFEIANILRNGPRFDPSKPAGLHEFDLPFLYDSRPLWDIVVIVLSIGGIFLSSTTLWPMFKRLARHGRRVVVVLRPVRARKSMDDGRSTAMALTGKGGKT
jgi:hypothetical protein